MSGGWGYYTGLGLSWHAYIYTDKQQLNRSGCSSFFFIQLHLFFYYAYLPLMWRTSLHFNGCTLLDFCVGYTISSLGKYSAMNKNKATSCNVGLIIRGYCNVIYTCITGRCILTCFSHSHSFMMTSSNGNMFLVTGPLWAESTGHRWIPLIKTRDAELWCYLWLTPERTVELTLVIWDVIVLIMTAL